MISWVETVPFTNSGELLQTYTFSQSNFSSLRNTQNPYFRSNNGFESIEIFSTENSSETIIAKKQTNSFGIGEKSGNFPFTSTSAQTLYQITTFITTGEEESTIYSTTYTNSNGNSNWTSFGSIYITYVPPTMLLETSTTETFTRGFSSTTTGTNTIITFGVQNNELVQSFSTVSTIRSTLTTTQLTRDALTSLKTEYNHNFSFNTIYQAETRNLGGFTASDSPEVLYCMDGESVEIYTPAKNVAHTATRTSYSYEYETISLFPTTIPPNHSDRFSTITGAQYSTETITTTRTANVLASGIAGRYTVFPPTTRIINTNAITGFEDVILVGSTATSSFTNETRGPQGQEIIKYNQSTTKKTWYTSISYETISVNGIQFNGRYTEWKSSQITIESQNKYVEIPFSGVSSNSFLESAGDSIEGSLFSSTRIGGFSVSGFTTKSQTKIQHKNVLNTNVLDTVLIRAPIISHFYKFGAKVGNNFGAAYSANWPFAEIQFVDVVSHGQQIKTPFPQNVTLERGNSSISLNIVNSKFDYTVKTENTTQTSGSSPFVLVGQPSTHVMFTRVDFTEGLIGGGDTNTWVYSIRNGAYKVMDNFSTTTTMITKPLTFSGSEEITNSSFYQTISYIVPNTFATFLARPHSVWTAPRNITENPYTFITG